MIIFIACMHHAHERLKKGKLYVFIFRDYPVFRLMMSKLAALLLALQLDERCAGDGVHVTSLSDGPRDGECLPVSLATQREASLTTTSK